MSSTPLVRPSSVAAWMAAPTATHCSGSTPDLGGERRGGWGPGQRREGVCRGLGAQCAAGERRDAPLATRQPE
jgi:hypothetical protein